MNLDDVHRGTEPHRRRRRIGRGTGSGRGKTSGRGHKGQGSRAGASHHVTFQGGAMPLIRRVPKRGFNNRFALVVVHVNLGDLDATFAAGDKVTPDAVVARGLVRPNFDVLKVLANGELTKKLTISAHRFSQAALAKIDTAGGKIDVLPGKKRLVRGKPKEKTPTR